MQVVPASVGGFDVSMEIIIEKTVVETIKVYTSRHPSTETGGFLYGRINPAWVYIGDLSEAGPNADKTTDGVKFDREYLIQYTLENLKRSFFVLGSWHTHPAGTTCNPSSIDISTMHSFQQVGNGRLSIFCISMLENEKVTMRFLGLSAQGNPIVINSIKIRERKAD